MSSKADLEKARALWYKKLEEEGFMDIERADGNLKVWSTNFYVQCPHSELWVAKAEYYRMASRFLNEFRFASPLEKTIWEYHSNGVTIRAISKILTAAKVKKMAKTQVWEIVKRLENIMKKLYLAGYSERYEG